MNENKANMTKLLTKEIKIGDVIFYENGKYRILKTNCFKSSKGSEFYQIEMKEITTGTKRNERIRSEDSFEKLETIAREFRFRYRDENSITIESSNSTEGSEAPEMLEIPADMLNGIEMLLEDDMKLIVECLEDEPVSVKISQ